MCAGQSNGVARFVNPNSFIAEKTGLQVLSPEGIAARKIGGPAGDVINPSRFFARRHEKSDFTRQLVNDKKDAI